MNSAVLQTLVEEEVDALNMIRDYLESTSVPDPAGIRPFLARLRDVRQKLDTAAAQYTRSVTVDDRSSGWRFSR